MNNTIQTNQTRNLLSILVVFVGLCAILFLLPRPQTGDASNVDAEENLTAITNARLYDGEQVIESATLLFGNSKVIAADRTIKIPEHAKIIDGSGHTVLPGLIDSHVYAFGSARTDALRFGVTTMLDMFTAPQMLPEARRMRESLEPSHQADLFSAGYLATAAGGHGTQFGLPVPTIASADKAEDWVAERLDEGSDYIKIIIEDGSSWGNRLPTLDTETIKALTDAAHAQGVMAVAHVSTLAGAEIAFDAGVDGLVHLFADEPIPDTWLENAADSDFWVVPTTTVLAGAYGHSGADGLQNHATLGSRLNTTQLQSLTQTFPGSELRQTRWPLVMQNLSKLIEAGIPILAGSDAPNPGTAHGASMTHELQLLVEAGMTPLEAIQSATSVPAEWFGLKGRGCLKPDCRADLILIEGNPLNNIDAIGSLVGVWKNGHAVKLELSTKAASDTVPTAAISEPFNLLQSSSRWIVSTDQFMGGNSVAEQQISDTTLVVEGELRDGSAFPYAGTMWMASDVPMQAENLNGYRELRLTLSGNQASYRIMLFSGENINGMPIMRDFSAEQLAAGITLNLDELAGLDLGQLRAIGVFAADRPGAFEFTIEQARLD